MNLEYRPDFEATRERWDAFWAGTLGRPALHVRAPKQAGRPVVSADYRRLRYRFGHEGTVDEWLDFHEEFLDNTLLFGEALPAVGLSFAPDHFSALLGADIALHPDQFDAWVEPFVKEWDDTEIALQKKGYWWDRTMTFMQGFKERFTGRALLVPPHIQGGLDCLSAIRGNQELLLDLMDAPEKVEAALQQVNRAIRELQAFYIEACDVATWGSINRHRFYYTQGLIDVPQCDFSCMISPEMFQRFQLPALREECRQLGPAVYHLDGPGALPHLEVLCGLPEIEVIQWQPGAAGQDQDWRDLYRTIDRLGKGLMLSGERGYAVGRELWPELQSPYMLIAVDCDSADNAKRILDEFGAAG